MLNDLELRREIEEIASQFKLFECIACAEAVKQFLVEQGIHGKHIKLFTGSTEEPFSNIYHEVLQENILVNGRPEAIAVNVNNEELIFDNIHPHGISRDEWLDNLYSPVTDMGINFQITELDF
jgi:hypothetical protein